MIEIPDLEGQNAAKIDASIGLLNNVPQAILNKLNLKLNTNGNVNEKIEVTVLYGVEKEQVKNFIESLNGEFEDLGFNFAIVRIGIDKLSQLAASKYVQYIELPKSLYESDLKSSRASCVPEASSTYNVTGKGVLVGFIDSGIDYTHPAFRNTDGTTRIEYIYDLSDGGKIYDKAVINRALKSNNPESIVPEYDETGHGTHVAGDACGGGNIPDRYKGIAQEASIAMVKGSRGIWVLSSQIMQGLKFLLDISKELDMPLVVNISLSTNNGAHDGNSLLEQYIRTVSNLEKVTICIAAGNEGDASHHVGDVLDKFKSEIFNVASDETQVIINFYKSILPDITLKITSPGGQDTGIIRVREGYFAGNVGRDRYDIYVSGPKPFELDSEIQIIISSVSSDYIVSGEWRIDIDVLNDYKGYYSMWLPISEGLNPLTKFLEPDFYNTLGIPATVDNIIAVGSYNATANTLSSFSGRGKNNGIGNMVRPDITAPGENVIGPSENGGYDSKTGTSMATPQVAGICALLSEWGIVKGNDPYLFGQRLKYYLVKGAERRRTDLTYPNPLWGYGTVCAYNSLNLVQDTIYSLLGGRKDMERQTTDIVNTTNEVVNEKIKNILQEFKKLNTPEDEVLGIIVQYTDESELKAINNLPGTIAIPLYQAFAIVRIPISELEKLSQYVKDIIPVYNPAIYTLTALSPVEASGAPTFNDNPYLRLNGKDTIVGIVDTGIDYLNEEFMLEDDTTRILTILDQNIAVQDTPNEIKFGTEYSEAQINQAIQLSKQGGDPYSIVPSKDENGHGTMAAGIIGGRGRNPDLMGAAPNCKFAVVKAKEVDKVVLQYAGVATDKRYVYGDIELILAIKYLIEFAVKQGKPIVLYFPFGSNIGGHDGSSPLEQILLTESRRTGVIPVAGSGNGGDTQTHIEGRIANQNDIETLQIRIGKNQNNLNFEIYCAKPDRVKLGIVSPSGEILNAVDIKLGNIIDYKFTYEGTKVSIFYLYPNNITGDETIIIRFRDIREGIWQFRLYGERIVDGRYWSWLPQRELLDKDTRFINPIQRTTLTVPSTSQGVISTAYYNQEGDTVVSSSGKGYTRDGRIKPDVAVGGINAIVTKPGGGIGRATGSSVATAVLAGCCALILQWAIVDGNDPSISFQRLLTYVIGGTKIRQGDIYPNNEWGYGIFDMERIFDSFRNYAKDNKYIEFKRGNLFFRIPKDML